MPNLTFTVDSALLSELGEKLVETVHVALIELIKNAYDADANTVIIKFKPQSTGGPELHIVDNGIGMTFDKVKKYWMRIATTHKTVNQNSQIYGRPRTGSKGIGRFSCRRLGKYLKLSTIGKREDGKFEKTEVEFPWDEFKAGSDVTLIECNGSREIIEKAKTGTTLIIKNAEKDEWTERGYDYLRRQMGILVVNRGIKRNGYKEDPGFNIFLDVPQYEKGGVSDLREKIINAGWATLTAKVNKEGHAVCKLIAKVIGEKEVVSNKSFPNLEGVKLKIGIMVDDKEQMRDKKVLSIGSLEKILPLWGGVQVRYNGFRVYPYGDDDWLGIDHERGLRRGAIEGELSSFASTLRGVNPKRAKLSMLSMRSYVGNVEIDSKANGFEMKTNREGFIYTKSVDELIEFVRFAIDWSTIYRDYYIRTSLKKKAELAREYLESVLNRRITPEEVVEKSVEYIQDEVNNLLQDLPLSDRHSIEQKISKATDAIIKYDKSNKEELNHLRLISSTSTLLLVFTHEVRSLISDLEANNSILGSIEDKLKNEDRTLLQNIRKNLNSSKIRMLELMNMTSLIGIESKSASPSKLAIRDKIEYALNCFQLIIKNYDIDIDIADIPNNIIVGPMLEAELYSILLNVLSNSIKSVIAEGKDKEIKIEASRERNKTKLIIKDKGIGIDERYFDDVFVPFINDPQGKLYKKLENKLNPEDKYFVGTGSGLGLSIIKEIIQNLKGDIHFNKPNNNWKSELEIILP